MDISVLGPGEPNCLYPRVAAGSIPGAVRRVQAARDGEERLLAPGTSSTARRARSTSSWGPATGRARSGGRRAIAGRAAAIPVSEPAAQSGERRGRDPGPGSRVRRLRAGTARPAPGLGRSSLGVGRGWSSSARDRSAACSPRTSRASPRSRCSSRRPSTPPRSSEQGLRVSGRADFTARARRAATDPRRCCRTPTSRSSPRKATDVEPARPGSPGRFPGATVMTIQNGLGAEEIVARARRLAAALRRHVHERHEARRQARRVRPRHRDLARPLRAARRTSRAQEVAALIVESGLKAEALRRPAAGAVVEADLQRDRERRRRADRPPARLPLRADGASPPTSATSCTSSSTRARRSPPPPASSSHDDPWEMNVLATQRGSRALSRRCSRTWRRAGRPRSSYQRRARPRGRAARRRAPLHDGALPARQGAGGVLLVRVCVVGCGAVGSLFAANLARSTTSRSGRTTSTATTSTRSTRRPAAVRRRRRRRPSARHGRRRRAPAVRLRDRRDEGDAHLGRRSRRPRTRSPTAASRRCRTASATRRRSPSTSSA